jgi:hypothetical protein
MACPHPGQYAAESGIEAAHSGQEIGMTEAVESQRYQNRAGLGNMAFPPFSGKSPI